MEAECEAMACHLHSEAEATWKKMHEVMYNHQLEYDRWLTDFLKEVEMMLANMRDQIWTTVHTLTESKGITFEDCLSLALCILILLPQIPVDVSYQTQILLTIAYCLESSVYSIKHRAALSHGDDRASTPSVLPLGVIFMYITPLFRMRLLWIWKNILPCSISASAPRHSLRRAFRLGGSMPFLR